MGNIVLIISLTDRNPSFYIMVLLDHTALPEYENKKKGMPSQGEHFRLIKTSYVNSPHVVRIIGF